MTQSVEIVTQSQLSLLLITLGKWFLVALGFTGLMKFSQASMPPPEQIEEAFTITLPETADHFGWYSEDGRTLARFTVDQMDVDPTLFSVRSGDLLCLIEWREWGFMPEFYQDEAIAWWRPDEAKTFDGVSCEDYNTEKGSPASYNLLVEYGSGDKATVFIEEVLFDAN